MNENNCQVDKGFLEVLRIYEEKRQVMINTIETARKISQFIVTASSVIFAVLNALNMNTFVQILTKIFDKKWDMLKTPEIISICLMFILIAFYVGIVCLLCRPLKFCDWTPGISSDRDKLTNYFYGMPEEEIVNRKIAILINEINWNRNNVEEVVKNVDCTQKLFSFSIVVLLLLFLFGSGDLSQIDNHKFYLRIAL